MKRNYSKIIVWMLATAFLVFVATPCMASTSATIVGTVSSDYTIVTDDEQVYEIGEGEKGDAVTELVGKKVRVTGEVAESDGTKIITVAAYEVIEE